jgi:tRNA A37 threonylcarbamoyladenosine dehydratase
VTPGEAERFARIERVIGTDGLERLARARVVVCGLGAVGSYAVEGLVRAGIGHLRVVDFDVVQYSNFNRQLYALESTVGLPKVEVARMRVHDIHPECDVEALQVFVHTDTLDQVLGGPPDLVIDAIDSMTPKVSLIEAAFRRGIPVVSSMGAALRSDPGRVRVGRLADVTHCPMARRVRRFLRGRGVPVDIPCVHSDEPTAGLPDTALGEAEEGSDAVVERGRKRRPLGSLSTITGIFGLTAATEALKILLEDRYPNSSSSL